MNEPLALLLLLLIANGAPVAARGLLGDRFDWPLDGGRQLADGYPVLGRSKTWLGVVVAIGCTLIIAPLVGLPWLIGLLIGSLSMLGDALSSLVKRRLGLSPGARAIGLDQLPESLLPLLACQPLLDLAWAQIVLLAAAFTLADLLISRILFHLGMRQHPH